MEQTDLEFFECREHFLFGASPPQRVFALQGCNGLDCVCATDRLHGCFREAEVLDLALLDQVLHGSRDVFDRHTRIDTVLIKEIDGFDLEALQ